VHVDPPLKMLFDAMAAAPASTPPDPEDHDEVRRRANETMLLIRPQFAADIETTDVELPVDAGAITVRTYRPASVPLPMPTLFFIHGGGWFQGNLDTAEVEMGTLPESVPCFTVSVAYRLAPEHRFPTPLDDCHAAYRWLVENADSLGVDVTRIAIAGTSAGGNLAAALCIRIRDEGLPMPVVQMLDAPALDLTMASPSVATNAEGAGLTREALSGYVGRYLRDAGDATNPLASPLFADDLSGLPPAVIVVAEHDPVRDDGERYLARLHDAGVAAASVRVLAQFHGAWIIPITVTSRVVADLRIATLRRAFEGTLDPLAP
jgi:acetyl esterase